MGDSSTFLLAMLFAMILVVTTNAQTKNAFTSSEKAQIVARHNLYRFQTLVPPASNMKTIVWDDVMAQIAANYTDNCQFSHNPQLQTIYASGPVGENIYISTSSANSQNASVDAWAGEKPYYTYSNNSCAAVSIV